MNTDHIFKSIIHKLKIQHAKSMANQLEIEYKMREVQKNSFTKNMYSNNFKVCKIKSIDELTQYHDFRKPYRSPYIPISCDLISNGYNSNCSIVKRKFSLSHFRRAWDGIVSKAKKIELEDVYIIFSMCLIVFCYIMAVFL